MSAGKTTVIDDKKTTEQERHKEKWVDYWVEALKYAEQVGGVSYQRTKDFFAGDNDTWKNCFAIPLIWSGYLNPVKHGKETTPAPGWTMERIRWRLEDRVGLPTPPPFAPPNRFEQQTTRETAKNPQDLGETRGTL